MSQIVKARAPNHQQEQLFPTLDVLLVNVADLLCPESRAEKLLHLHLLASSCKRPGYKGPWILALTHTAKEQDIAFNLTWLLTHRGRPFQGVVSVHQRPKEDCMEMAKALHKLHFPNIQQRLPHILLLGSSCESALFQRLKNNSLTVQAHVSEGSDERTYTTFV